MTPSARIAAAIEILADIRTRRRPAADALKDWGLSHRFAGSGDRAGIAGLVYDVLRRRASSAWAMGDDTPRALVLGMLAFLRGHDLAALEGLFDGRGHAPQPLNEAERARLSQPSPDGAPAWVAGDYPEWLDPAFAEAFGEARIAEGEALATRAPLDLRVNALKADRDKVRGELAHLGAEPTPWSPTGLRIPLPADGRAPAVQSEEAFVKGRVEVQDEASQVAALMTGAAPGEQVLDLCAGAGGKTLALAAMMENRGQLFAHDSDIRRLAPIHDRLARAGTRVVQVRAPKGRANVLADLEGRMDLVVIDAPCTGAGAWRRNPDAKWRLRPGALDLRLKDQAQLLAQAPRFVRPGGRLAYITCSLLPPENEAQVRAFLGSSPDFAAVAPQDAAKALGERAMVFLRAVRVSDVGLTMSPARTGTDGFFISLLRRAA